MFNDNEDMYKPQNLLALWFAAAVLFGVVFGIEHIAQWFCNLVNFPLPPPSPSALS